MVKEFKIINKESISEAIENLKAKEKDTFTASEIAKTYRANISTALKKGYSFKEITQIFNTNNCNITAKELELAFKKLRGNVKTKASTKINTSINNIESK